MITRGDAMKHGHRRESRSAATDPWARLRALPRCQSGQAIYIVVVFFFLMAGLLFLVINSGEKVNHKVGMQGAADAAAASGAGWYARGLNTISMCNVTETQLLSLIVLCDTLETVTPPARQCIDNLVGNIGKSRAGHDIPNDPYLSQWLIVGEAAGEQQVIHRFDDIVKAVNWPQYLTYDTGVLWECTKLLNAFSHAMAADTPLAAQREAHSVGLKDEAEVAFILPLWPKLPVTETGQFSDFRAPMVTGHLPNTRGQDGHEIGMFSQVIPYRGYNGQVMGPWSYWREPFLRTQPMGLFDLSRFSMMFREVSQRKLNMLFDPGANDRVALGDTQWVMDFDEAKKVPQNEIRRIWWEAVDFDARYPNAEEVQAFPVPPSANQPVHWQPRPVPRTYTTPTLNGQPPAGYIRATQSYEGADPREGVWYRVERRRTPHYPQLGIFAPHPPTHPDGSDWPYTDAEMHTYWHVSIRRFNGLEKDTDTTLHRRYLGQPANLWPIMLDPSNGFNTVTNVNDRFTFNGFAYREGKVKHWSEAKSNDTGRTGLPPAKGFKNPNPIEEVVAYSQARVYNRYSWDLFTQHWKVKLMRLGNTASTTAPVPESRWAWMSREINQAISSDLNGILTDEDLKPVKDLLEAYDNEYVGEVSH
jgi:hypothetical protein